MQPTVFPPELPTPSTPQASRRRLLLSLAALGAAGGCAAVPDAPADGAPGVAVGVVPRETPGAATLLPHGTRVPTVVGPLAVRDTGPTGAPGEVIVLWPSILADHRIYREPIEAWRGRHRLLAIDGPGHGDSGPAPGAFSMAQCGQALAEVLDARGIAQPVVIVGTSWGGLVAGEFALAQPHRTRAVVMLNTPVHVAPRGPGFGDRFVAWGSRWIHDTALYRDGVARAFFLPATRQRNGLTLQDFHRHLRDADGAALARSVRSVLIEREPLAPRLARIAAPTLFVAGRHDTMYPLEGLRVAAATLPLGSFEVLETAHISVVDAPAESTALIDRFLSRLQGA